MDLIRLHLILACGCGRLEFDSASDAGRDATGPDAPPITDLVQITGGNGTNWIRRVTAVPDGYVVAGAAEGPLAFDGVAVPNVGETDAFVLALDLHGRRRWSATCASGNEDLAHALATDLEGNVYIGGTSGGALDCGGGPLPSGSYMAWLASFTRDGVHRWSQSFPSADPLPGQDIDGVRALAIVDGRLVATGLLHGTVDLGGGPLAPLGGAYDGFVATYTLDGGFLAARRFGNSIARDLTTDDSGQLYVVGTVDGTSDFGGGPLSGANSGFVASFTPALATPESAAEWTERGTPLEVPLESDFALDGQVTALAELEHGRS